MRVGLRLAVVNGDCVPECVRLIETETGSKAGKIHGRGGRRPAYADLLVNGVFY